MWSISTAAECLMYGWEGQEPWAGPPRGPAFHVDDAQDIRLYALLMPSPPPTPRLYFARPSCVSREGNCMTRDVVRNVSFTSSLPGGTGRWASLLTGHLSTCLSVSTCLFTMESH